MKREIKFRVWDNEKKKMSKPFTIGAFFIQWLDGDIDMPLPFAKAKKDRFNFLQFTGPLDKNGVDIFEGDNFKTDSGHFYEVFYNKETFCFLCEGKHDKYAYNLWQFKSENIEVIGNVQTVQSC